MACPVHFVNYEKGCKTCEQQVLKLVHKAVRQGIVIPFSLSWKDKVALIQKYDLEPTDEPIIH